jgi:periplasmic protein TonB
MKKLSLLLALFLSISYKAQTKEEVYALVDEIAEFKGGQHELVNYINKEIKYPGRAKDAKIGGKVYIKFIVAKDGAVKDVVILKGIENCPECDKEALRVISSMPKWKPAKKDGKVVNCYYNIPIKFDPA